jgi:type 1 fimbria pilin
MKKILLATALSLCVTSAFAAETAVMKVQGTLTNSACTPELSNGGVVDYGIIRLGELSATDVNQLGQKNIDLTINCTVETRVGWSMMDDQSSTSAGINIKMRRLKVETSI